MLELYHNYHQISIQGDTFSSGRLKVYEQHGVFAAYKFIALRIDKRGDSSYLAPLSFLCVVRSDCRADSSLR